MSHTSWVTSLKTRQLAKYFLAAIFLFQPIVPVFAQIRVVATLPVLADIARQVGGSHVTVQALAKGTEDPHYVIPRPSLMAAVSQADLFVEVGMQLELWTERVLDGAGNANVQPGQIGHVFASDGAPRLEVPQRLTRAEGDIHPFGNPHLWLNPLNGIVIAKNIADGLKRVDPANATDYDSNVDRFISTVYLKLFGDDLVKQYGGKRLADKFRHGELDAFLQSEKAGSKLGGWMKQAQDLRGQKVVTYHKAWSYLEEMFGFQIINTVEEKPGIPPSAQHRDKLLAQMKQSNARILILAPFEARRIAEQIAAATGARLLVLPLDVQGAPGVVDYFTLFDKILSEMSRTAEPKG